MTDHSRQKGWVPFSTFAFVETIPQRINYLEHLLPFKGSDDDLTIPWGVYGTTSLNRCAYYAAHYARARKRQSVQLTVWYYFEEVGRSMTRLPRTLEECRGFVHTGRIASELRDQMREEMLQIAREIRTPQQVQQLENLDGALMLMHDPKLVREYMRRQKDVLAVVHPVLQELDPHQDGGVLISSFKLKRDRIKLVEARYFSKLIVEI